MSIELTEELRRNKAQFRYLRERCGISLREIAEKAGFAESTIEIAERPGRKTYPSAKAWEYLLEQFENHKTWVDRNAIGFGKSGLPINIYRTTRGFGVNGIMSEDNAADAQKRNARAAELAAVLSFENIDTKFVYTGHEVSEKNIEKATFRGIRERCRISQKTAAQELGYKSISILIKYEDPDQKTCSVSDSARDWSFQKLEAHKNRVQAAIDSVKTAVAQKNVKRVLFPYYLSQKHFNLYKTDDISFSEINAANTETAVLLEKTGIESVFLYPETGYKYPDEYLIKTD